MPQIKQLKWLKEIVELHLQGVNFWLTKKETIDFTSLVP